MIKLQIFLFLFLFCIFRKCDTIQVQSETSAKRDIRTVCQTHECQNAATTIRESIDPNVAPCDDFYKFACGKFLETAVIPKENDSVDRYSSLQQKVREQMKSDLEEPIQPNEPRFITLSKNFYKACMDTNAIEKNGLRTILGKLKKMGGWPLLEADLWKEKNFDWKQATYAMQKEGFNTYYLFSFTIVTDFSNSTKNVLNINQPFLRVERESLVKGFNDKYIKAYFNYMTDMAVSFGANKARAEEELREVIDFEMKLVNITLSREARKNQTGLNNLMTVKELTKKYPSIPWKEYFNTMLKSMFVIGDDEIIKVSVPTYFEKFEILMKKTPKRVVANYLCWQAVDESSPFLTDKIQDLQRKFSSALSSLTEKKARWKECFDITSGFLDVSFGALFVRKNFKTESKRSAEELAVTIKQRLKNILKEADWMDEKTRTSALNKLESMKTFIGYPDEILDDKTVGEYYKTLEITPDDYLQAYSNVTIFLPDHAFSNLRKRVDKSDWPWLSRSDTAATTAGYDDHLNDIYIPAGILQDIFFNKDRPQYLNFAAIGSFVIGNTIITAFDKEGRQFDKNGNLNDWWTPETNTKFDQKAACIIQQYGNYTVKYGGVKLNGTEMERKNIADNGGIKMSYQAYQDWVKRHGPEHILPGLKYSQSQLFWIQAAITQCAKYTKNYAKNFNLGSEFIYQMDFPSEFRVTGVFANRPEFASDFNCPVGSKMNPVKKCSVW